MAAPTKPPPREQAASERIASAGKNAKQGHWLGRRIIKSSGSRMGENVTARQ